MVKQVGVIGAGQMGVGISHVCALGGYEVTLVDVSMERANQGLARIRENMGRQVGRQMISDADMIKAVDLLSGADQLEALASADIVIEAATEDETVKSQIFEDICPLLKQECLLGSNTSSISITRLASRTKRPEKFMGVHFMNPVPLMKLVELIPGIATSPETIEIFSRFAKDLGKTVTQSEDFPAFIVNRILMPMINEAIYALYEGVGTVEDIDIAMHLGANHPMGPLTLADFIGLDTCLSIMQVMYEGLSDTKYRPCPLLVKYVEAGWVGRKSGRGFYDYTGEGAPKPTR